MYDDLIARRPIAMLRQSVDAGIAYYSCERFEDALGRLVVGIGAKLEGRTLDYVAQQGRTAVYASPVALRDNTAFRVSLRRVIRQDADDACERVGEDSDLYEGVWDEAADAVRKAVGEAMQAVHQFCPRAVKFIQDQCPYPRDLMHGVQVAMYATRLMDATEQARKHGLTSSAYPYSSRVRDEVFLAGLVHDIGRWQGKPRVGHARYGAEILDKHAADLSMLRSVSQAVAQHHWPPAELSGSPWEIHRAAPVAIAEAVLESPGSHGAAVHSLISHGIPDELAGVLTGLCNLEGVTPPQTLVHMAPTLAGGLPELAVSLRAPAGDPFRPYLLRFARLGARGLAMPLLASDATDHMALRCLTVPGHPACAGRKRQVVSLLPDAIYTERFGRYDSLVTPFREMLEQWFDRQDTPSQNP